jgi:hypothetical protein
MALKPSNLQPQRKETMAHAPSISSSARMVCMPRSGSWCLGPEQRFEQYLGIKSPRSKPKAIGRETGSCT